MDAQNPAKLAAADQAVAVVGGNLSALIDFYRDEDAAGTDRTELVSTMTALMIKQSHPANMAALLAVALARLAHPTPCMACPECRKSAVVAALLEG